MINYIKRQPDYKLYISNNHEMMIKDIPIQRFFNHLLTKQLTDLASREKQTKKQLYYKSKVPIYIDDENLFICMKSYRLNNSFYINFHSIMSYEYINGSVVINFKTKHSIRIKEKHTFTSQMKKCNEIIDFLD